MSLHGYFRYRRRSTEQREGEKVRWDGGRVRVPRVSRTVRETAERSELSVGIDRRKGERAEGKRRVSHGGVPRVERTEKRARRGRLF